MEPHPDSETRTQPDEKLQFESYLRTFDLTPKDCEVPLLDVGTGTGAFVTYVREVLHNAHAFGVELDQPTMPPDAPHTGSITGDAVDLPFKDSSFELVLARAFMGQFLWRDPIPPLTEMLRVLAPGGRLLFDVPSHETIERNRVESPHAQFSAMQEGLDRLQWKLASLDGYDVDYGPKFVTVTKRSPGAS